MKKILIWCILTLATGTIAFAQGPGPPKTSDSNAVQQRIHPPPGVPKSFGKQTLGNPPIALDERVWFMKFSPDGQKLFAVTDRIYDIDWRRKTSRVIWMDHDNETMMGAYFSPDGSLYARLNNGGKIHLHETRTGTVRHTIERQDRLTVMPGWARDKELIAIADRKQILIHHTKTGALVRKIPQGQTDIGALALSPDGKLLVAGNTRVDENRDEGFLLYHLDGDAPPIRLPGSAMTHINGCLSFTPDSKLLAVHCYIGRRQTLYFWDLAENKLIYRASGHSYNSITHSPDSSLVAICGLNDLDIRDARTGREVFRHQGESINEAIWSAAFSPDGKTLATGVEDHIKFWDTLTWKEIDPDPNLNTPVSALAFSSDGRHLATGSLDGELVLWDWEKKTAVWKSPSPRGQCPIEALSIDPSKTMIGVQQQPRPSAGGQVRIVDFATGEIRRFLSPPSPTFAKILFRPDQKTALIATTNHAILHWDVVADRLIKTTSVPFLNRANSTILFEISTFHADPGDPDLIWWTARQLFGSLHLKDSTETCTFEQRNDFNISAPTPSREHQFIHMGQQVWNLPSRHCVRPQGDNYLPSVSYPNGNLLFIANQGKVLVFDILSQGTIHEIDFGPGVIKALDLTPDGKTLVAGTTGGLHYLNLPPQGLPAGTTSETLWQVMGSDIHWQAYLAAWALARQPDFIPFLTQCLTPAPEPSPVELHLLQSLLADGNHEVRQIAARKLLDLGLPLAPETYETLRKNGLPSQLPQDPQMDLSKPNPPPTPILIPLSDHRRAMRAIMILRESSSPAALKHLELLATGHPKAPVTIASRKALIARSTR